ncbi:MAG: DUF3455 domain-containing protein [Candidatus Eremiobacteraeota bacterium]|nr:DUF3455 domain-containing protein [Candidatus Eremiobacteraeota bacterium]
MFAPAFLFAYAFSAGLAIADLPSEPPPPPGTTVVREVQAGGVQVYACRASANGAFQWTLVGPKAILVEDDGSDFGTHGAGPMWTALDGSSIVADGAHPLVKIDRPQSVPTLLLTVTTSHGDGVLSGVRFVRRSDTEGGLASTSGCDAAHANVTTASHYSAVYTFYR